MVWAGFGILHAAGKETAGCSFGGRFLGLEHSRHSRHVSTVIKARVARFAGRRRTAG